MNDHEEDIPELDFSEKYTKEHAREYFHKHNNTGNLWRRISNWREITIARKALRLAGNPDTILDLPSGTGRFWKMLSERKDRKLYAADYNPSMFEVGLEKRPKNIAGRFETFQTSAFDIPKPDNFVENIFCMRLLHHIGERKDRMKMLREFHRVTSDTVVVSLWVDGNVKAKKRAVKEQKRSKKLYQNRFVQPRERIEAEMRDAGFKIVNKVDFLKRYAMWRIYVLRKKH